MSKIDHKLTAQEAYQRDPKTYDFISLDEMKEWQKVCHLNHNSKSYFIKKLEANRELRRALWKYSRTMVYDSCERGGIYEFWAQGLRHEAQGLEETINLMSGEKVIEV